MVDHPGSSRARRALAILLTAGVLAVVGGGLLGPATASAAPVASAGQTPRSASAVAAADLQTPLKVTMDALDPGYLPEQGPIEITGTVTNRDDEAWAEVKMYAVFPGPESGVPPMQSPGDLETALDLPTDAYIGDRITDEGRPDLVAELAPGESSSYRIVVPSSALSATQGGVYWFGVHALGSSDSSPRDEFSDGRARTLLPYVPDRISTGLPTSLVVPLTRPVPYAADGSLTDLERWRRSLSSGGRLHDLVEFAATDPDDLTWMVDPALLDAIARLARGNPPRSLDPTTPLQDEDGGAAADTALPLDSDGDGVPELPTPDDAGEEGGDGGAGGAGGPVTDPDVVELAGLAQDWLRRTRGVLDAGQVMVLPYGNLDVQAALTHRPALIDLARAQQSQVLQAWGIDTTPVTAGPTGALDAATVRDAGSRDRTGTVLLDDDGLGLARTPAVARVDGTPVVVASSGVAQGGPSPGPALTTISLRQRVLAEAAVRVLRSDRQALVASLPTEWQPADPQEFFAGLRDVPWLDLDELAPLTSSVTAVDLDVDRLPGGTAHESDPDAGRRAAPLSADTVDGVSALIRAGDTLQNLLADNTRVAGVVTQEALTQASYAARAREAASRLTTGTSRAWIEDRLDAVQVSAPRGVTLSSESGGFSTTLTNDLDQPVTVRLQVRSDPGVRVQVPDTIRIGARSRNTVLLDASADDSTVHRITLEVTDVTGRPLGSTARLPIRYAQVSGVIWLIIGTGVGILFVAIVLRLVRRVRRSRRAAGEAVVAGDPSEPGERPGTRVPSPDPVR